MTRRIPSFLLAAALTSLALPASAQSANAVVGEKLDSGLGNLPHYSQWAAPSGRRVAAVRVEGESLDNQLGELPHYRLWVDRSGKDPMGTQAGASFRLASAKSGSEAAPKLSKATVQASN